MPLNDIQMITSRSNFNLLQALEDHRLSLKEKSIRLNKLIETVDNIIETIIGEKIMNAEDYYAGFDEAQYQKEAKDRWGETSKYAESQKKWTSYSKEQKEAIKIKGDCLTRRMVSQNPDASSDDPDVQAAIGEYHANINEHFYTCDIASLRTLTDMWVEDPRFAENYDRVRPGGAQFVREVGHNYCDRNE